MLMFTRWTHVSIEDFSLFHSY